MHRASPYNRYINQQDAQNSCDQTLFSIRCSTCFGLCQSIFRNNFINCTSHLVYADTKCDVQLIKLLLKMDRQSPKHVEHILKNKVLSQECCASCWFTYIQFVSFLIFLSNAADSYLIHFSDRNSHSNRYAKLMYILKQSEKC